MIKKCFKNPMKANFLRKTSTKLFKKRRKFLGCYRNQTNKSKNPTIIMAIRNIIKSEFLNKNKYSVKFVMVYYQISLTF
jgi:hypothetical protein